MKNKPMQVEISKCAIEDGWTILDAPVESSKPGMVLILSKDSSATVWGKIKEQLPEFNKSMYGIRLNVFTREYPDMKQVVQWDIAPITKK